MQQQEDFMRFVITWKHTIVSKIQFAFNLTVQRWRDDFLLILESPKAITEPYIYRVKLQTTRVSQTIANARSWDSEQVSQNVWCEFTLIISGLRYFTFPLALGAKGQPTSRESLAPSVMNGWNGSCKCLGSSALFMHEAHGLSSITRFLSWGSQGAKFHCLCRELSNLTCSCSRRKVFLKVLTQLIAKQS